MFLYCSITARARRAITPPRIAADDQFVTDTAPLGHLDCDVLWAEGAARLKDVVYEIIDTIKCALSMTLVSA